MSGPRTGRHTTVVPSTYWRGRAEEDALAGFRQKANVGQESPADSGKQNGGHEPPCSGTAAPSSAPAQTCSLVSGEKSCSRRKEAFGEEGASFLPSRDGFLPLSQPRVEFRRVSPQEQSTRSALPSTLLLCLGVCKLIFFLPFFSIGLTWTYGTCTWYDPGFIPDEYPWKGGDLTPGSAEPNLDPFSNPKFRGGELVGRYDLFWQDRTAYENAVMSFWDDWVPDDTKRQVGKSNRRKTDWLTTRVRVVFSRNTITVEKSGTSSEPQAV